MRWIVILLFCLSLSSCTINTPSSGQKIGRIVKLADEGMLNTTCEGELIRGGLVDGSGSMGSSFHFTIESPHLRQIAYQAFERQLEVIMVYRVEMVSALWRSESVHPHFVTGIEFVR